MKKYREHPTTPLAMVTSLWCNRQLILQMTRREIAGRYRGSLLGVAWSFITPLLMLASYTFVFSGVFKSRWIRSANESKIDFAIVLFAGMIVYAVFSEMITRAPGLVISNVNFVKKVVFPLEVLPWVTLGSTLFHSFVSLIALLVVQLLVKFTLPWTTLLLPIVLLPLICASLGLSWFLAATAVFVRDVGQITGVITTVLMFLSALFYPVSSLPPEYQFWLKLNPLVLIITESHNVLVFGVVPDWGSLMVVLFAGMVVACGGFWWFQKVRKGFADAV